MSKTYPVNVKLTEENKTKLKKYQGMWQSQAGIRISQSDAINLAVYFFTSLEHNWPDEVTKQTEIKGI